MTEQELYNEYQKSDCKSFTDFLINKIAELKKTYRKQRNKRIDELQKKNNELNKKLFQAETDYDKLHWERNAILADRNKAKELLNEFMRISKASDEDFEHDYSELIAEAEQFLNEVEK